MRNGEKQSVTYHYISEDDFLRKVNEGFFAEYKIYHTVNGDWYYGTSFGSLMSMDGDNIIILSPNSYRDLEDCLPADAKSIYIYANNATIKKRLMKRGDDKDEAMRRIECDNQDFKGIENKVNRIFYNNEGTDIDELVAKIAKWVKGSD
jgi:guanylate kinase